MIRVTELLKYFNLYGTYDVDEYYLKRGSMIHRAIELYIKGTLDEVNLDEELKPYLNQFKKFYADTNIKLEEYEVRRSNGIITGQLDILGKIRNKLCLIDIKTGLTELPAYPIQTAMYAMLLNKKVDRYCLHITKEKYVLKAHKEHSDFNVARSLINVYQYLDKTHTLPPFLPHEGGAMLPSNNNKE